MKRGSIINRRECLALAAGAALAFRTGQARASAMPDVVVELFTSQGCSSCPPADRIIAELQAMPGVLALTYHVDYWDYLGWKDTLGSPDFSQRQYDYAKARGDMEVYTPQLIVNGGKPMVGSQRSEIFSVLKQSRQAQWQVPLSITDGGKEIVIDIGAGSGATAATLWVMPVIGRVAVKIEKGEIAGREMIYHNVVRRLVPAGLWSGKPDRISLPKDGLLPRDSTACVALLQENKVGPVLGCASWGTIGS
jgi:hypothetical protein